MWVALPAMLLPVLIHLLNRLRYKTVPWAATLFLLKANRAATRRAKVRQYLLLACRSLLILFLIWAMARPLAGGWIGSAAGGAPEVVLILLDRSASMEAKGAGGGESKRAHALALLSSAAKQSTGSRFVLIENVLRQPLEIGDAQSLAALQMAGPTDTAADIPAMFRAALNYLTTNKSGRSQIWVASDLQSTNWRSESSEWQDIAARFAGLPQGVSVRILDLSTTSGSNASLTVKAANLRLADEKSRIGVLSLTFEIRTDEGGKETVPLYLTRNGAKSEMDVALTGGLQRQTYKFELPKTEPGWGKAELAADENISDNVAYFAYALPIPLRTLVIGSGPIAQRLRLAAAPERTRSDRTAELIAPAAMSGLEWKQSALVIWAADAPDEATAGLLREWVDNGGILLCFPPPTIGVQGLLGLSWSAMEEAEANAPFRVASWDDLDGPLAGTENGAALPLPRLELLRRRLPVLQGNSHVYGAFADGKPFLVGQKLGDGQIFAFATTPDATWGNFADGFVLLPAIQRLLTVGGQRLSPPVMAIAGQWQPKNADERWQSLEPGKTGDLRWTSGVYQFGERKIALNRPESEDLPDLTEPSRLPELLPGVKLDVMVGAMAQRADSLQSEIWPMMIIGMMLFMCGEMYLATSRAMAPARNAAGTIHPETSKSPPTGALT